MNQTLRLATRFLASLILLVALAHGVADALGTSTTTPQDKSIEQGTRQCLREAQREFNRCRRARGRRGALARCRRADRQRRSACSG
jgi:hypothetical protein